jgi:hypothetical protein
MTRREALCKMGAGFGMLSLASLLGDTIARADAPANKASWMIQEPGFKPRAKHVIFLFMNGGLSQIDSFDHKPCSKSTMVSPCLAAICSTSAKRAR